MRAFLWIFLILPFATLSFAQPASRQFSYVSTDPAGSCANGQANQQNFLNGNQWTCKNSVWTLLSSGGGGTPGYQPNEILSGCGVEYVSALTFTVGTCSYTIAGITYSSPITSVTLTAADMTNPRIDVIGVDNTGAVFTIPGTPAMSPSEPSVDPSTQLGLIFVTVAANATTPSGIVATLLYDENTEWTCTASTHLNCASTSNPYHGTKDIEATAAVLNNNVTLVKPAAGTVDLSTQNTLIFYIRSKAAWPTAKSSGADGLRTLSLFWLNGSTQIGTAIVLRDGVFGFVSSNTTAYQQIAIPVGLFATGSNLVTTLKAQITGNGGTSSIGFYIDQVTLQSGTNGIVTGCPAMSFQGTWSAVKAYSPCDTVTSGSIGYVALAANTNVAVSTAATWAPLAPNLTGSVSQNIVAQTTYTLTHNLGSTDVVGVCKDSSNNGVGCQWQNTGVNTTVFTFSPAFTGRVTSFIPGSTGAGGGGGGGSSGCSGTETVTFSATPVFNLAVCIHEITLTGNITSFTVTGGTSGSLQTFVFIQDGMGSRTVVGQPAAMLGFFTIGATASKNNAQSFAYDGSNLFAIGAGLINQ